MAENSTGITHTAQDHINRIINWAKQWKSSWEEFLRLLWANPELINQQRSLTERLESFFDPVDTSLFSNQELVIRLLKAQSWHWHEQYLPTYEKNLQNFIGTSALPAFLSYLAYTEVGVQKACVEAITQKYKEDEELLTEIKLLHIIRLTALKATKELHIYESEALEAINNYREEPSADNWTTAISYLPILGFLWYKERPNDYLKQCLTLNMEQRPLSSYPKIGHHTALYCRHAAIELCKMDAWENLLFIKKNSRDWLSDYLQHALESPMMKNCSDKLIELDKANVDSAMQTRKESDIDELVFGKAHTSKLEN